MFEVGFGDAARAATRAGRKRTTLSALFAATALILLAAAFTAASANAAFSATDWKVTPSNLQAGQHSNVNLTIATDPVAGDQTSDDLKSATLDLPSGLLVNPQSVATPCTATQLSSDTCPAASQVGKISVQYRIGGSLVTSTGSVYSTTPATNSVINFGFVVRPSSTYAKFFFSSGITTGLTTVRSGPDADYGLTLSVPSIPNTVKVLGASLAMTIANISIDFYPRSGATQNGAYFTFNPTRCTPANSRATLVSYKSVSVTRTASFTPTNCDAPRFDPTFSISPSDTRTGKPTGISATITMPTADQTTQQSQIRDVSVTLPGGAGLDIDAVNAITAVCSETQFASDTCPAASQIGTTKANVPFLPSEMTGGIYLMNKTGFKFGYILRGVRGTIAQLRGSAAPATSGPGGLRATFLTLPQIPFSSATLNFTSKLVKNPPTCQAPIAYANISGYTGAQSTINQIYPLTECPLPPDTTITVGPGEWSRTATPQFAMKSTPLGATFECAIDGGAFSACPATYTTPTLSQGWHYFQARSVDSLGLVDTSPAGRSFQVDSIKPILTLSSPAQDAVVSGSTVTATFTTEAGATVLCSLDAEALEACTSPKTYTGVAAGTHSLVIIAKDAAGNYSVYAPRRFSVVLPPTITISFPTAGSTLNYNGFDGEFSVTNPSGTPLTITCRADDVTANDPDYVDECASPWRKRGLTPNHVYDYVVTATDEDDNKTEARVRFTSGIPMPEVVSAVGGPDDATTTDRTPSFVLQGGVDPYHPTVDWECGLAAANATPVYVGCGSPPERVYTAPSALPNGDYKLYTRSRSGSQVTDPVTTSFSVGDWAPTYTASTSTTQAAGHPNLDFNIRSNAGQLRSIDLLLPKGLIGSLNSFPKCPLEKVPTAHDCPANTQIGSVETLIKIVGLDINATGEVYLTVPQQPGDTAGLTIYVHTPLGAIFENVVIPLRLQLVNNSQYMRTFSDSIPVSTPYHVSDTAYTANFFVQEFDLHLNGSAGSPFPLLTNPSSCAAGQFASSFGDPDLNKTAALPFAYQATGCGSVPFTPTLTETYSSTVAGSTSSLRAQVTVPEGNSSINTVTVYQPPAAAPNYNALGAAGDRCPVSAIPTSGPVIFDPTNCPAQALVGKVSITSPLLPSPIAGKVYLVQRSPLPMFGVHVVDAGFGVKLDFVATNVVDPPLAGCDEAHESCGDRLKTRFYMAPDLPVSTIDMDISGPSRSGVGGQTLSGDLLVIAEPDDPSCRNSSFYDSFTEPHSGGPVAHAQTPIALSGCAQ